jgi:hypothetical protein
MLPPFNKTTNRVNPHFQCADQFISYNELDFDLMCDMQSLQLSAHIGCTPKYVTHVRLTPKSGVTWPQPNPVVSEHIT